MLGGRAHFYHLKDFPGAPDLHMKRRRAGGGCFRGCHQVPRPVAGGKRAGTHASVGPGLQRLQPGGLQEGLIGFGVLELWDDGKPGEGRLVLLAHGSNLHLRSGCGQVCQRSAAFTQAPSSSPRKATQNHSKSPGKHGIPTAPAPH